MRIDPRAQQYTYRCKAPQPRSIEDARPGLRGLDRRCRLAPLPRALQASDFVSQPVKAPRKSGREFQVAVANNRIGGSGVRQSSDVPVS